MAAKDTMYRSLFEHPTPTTASTSRSRNKTLSTPHTPLQRPNHQCRTIDATPRTPPEMASEETGKPYRARAPHPSQAAALFGGVTAVTAMHLVVAVALSKSTPPALRDSLLGGYYRWDLMTVIHSLVCFVRARMRLQANGSTASAETAVKPQHG